MASADAAHREKRRKRSEIRSDGNAYRACGDIEVLGKPVLEDPRCLRSELYSAGSTRRRIVRASSMVSSSISRSSLSHSRSISKHRHKSAHVHRSETEVKQHTRRKSISEDDDSSHYVYVPPRPKARSSTIKISERRREDDSSDTSEDGAMSTVSEESESEPEPKPKERKIKIIYVNNERPRSSWYNSLRVRADDAKTTKADGKASTKSLHRSNTTSSHRLRSQSAQDVREPKPVTKRSHSLSQSRLPTKSLYEPSMTGSKATNKRASFFGIFTPTIKEEKPPRL
jgi:hypothetical protein